MKTLLVPVSKVLQNSGAGGLTFTDEAGADIDPLSKLGVPTFSPIQDSRFFFNYHHTADTPKRRNRNRAGLCAGQSNSRCRVET